MKILLLCKRRYTNRDLVDDRFGRLFHLPVQWSRQAEVRVACMDYQGRAAAVHDLAGVPTQSLPLLKSPITSMRTVLDGAREFSPDIVVASSDIVYGLMGQALARHLGAKFVFDVYDDYRHFPINRYSGAALAFGVTCRRADLVLCASPALQKIVGEFNPRTTLVRNGVDPAIFHVGRELKRRESLGVAQDETLLIYPGSPVSHVDLDLLAEGLQELNHKGPPVKALFVGERSASAALSSPFIISHPAVGQAEVAGLMRASDIGIAPYRSTAQTRASAPCKIYEFLACGLPVVAAGVSDLQDLGIYGVRTYRPGNVSEFVDAIQCQRSAAGSATSAPDVTWDVIADRAHSAFATGLAAGRA